MYNAPYPDTYDATHVIFEKYKFEHELDTSFKQEGLPGLCNFYFYPVLPCKLPKDVIPIRKCDEIGYTKFGQWPRVHYYWWSFSYSTTVDTMQKMLGTSFIACSTSSTTNFSHLQNRMPIIPNMRIKDGYDAVSNTACLKLNFNGIVEPVWLGNQELGENLDVYLERLPLPF